MAFRWRGRRYIVDSVLAHWVETGAWWRQGDRLDRLERFGSDAVEPGPPADPERWVWRVEVAGAGRHASGQTGVFDLCLEPDPSASPSPDAPSPASPSPASPSPDAPSPASPRPGRWSLHAIYD